MAAEARRAASGHRTGRRRARQRSSAALDPKVLATFEAVAAPATASRWRWRAGHLHHLPRAAPAAGVQHRPSQRRDHPVRQLPAHPLLRTGRQRRTPHATDAVTSLALFDNATPSPESGSGRRLHRRRRARQSRARPATACASSSPTARWSRSSATRLASPPTTSPNTGPDRRARMGARPRPAQLHVRSDSLLLVQQMLGNFKVKNAGLQPLHARARLLAHEIGRVSFEHVGRAIERARRSSRQRGYGRGGRRPDRRRPCGRPLRRPGGTSRTRRDDSPCTGRRRRSDPPHAR